MEFSTKAVSPEKDRTDCLVVGVHEGRKLTPAARLVDELSGKAVSAVLKSGDLTGKPGATLMLHKLPGVAAARVLLVGMGKEGAVSRKNFRDALAGAYRALAGTRSATASVHLSEVMVDGADGAWVLEHAVVLANEAAYVPPKPGMKVEADSAPRLARLNLAAPAGMTPAQQAAAVLRGTAISHGQDLARDLGNLPPNICTPTYLADSARALARSHKLKVTVLDEAQMQKLGMNSLLSVTKGSRQPPKFIVLEYKGGAVRRKPIALVGKGITFDTGGISLKPGAEMDEMKYDMCGAASVLGTLKSVAELKLPLNVVGVIPTCENMPDGQASRPGDIVTSMSGQTVEILNTDAEGRLILCDALTYTERFQPEAVVDIATLTGACVIALGNHASGLFANKDELAHELLAAGEEAHDRAWHMPLWEDYQDALKSNFADMQNIGGRAGGSITAACFLSRFTKAYPWAHLDIAGTAWRSGKDKGATGRPVGLLTHFLMRRAAS
ncbi:MAG: leucyl aminopeptidase [Pseudomonadota bacterium]|nr:leucyl aminopeptidase [Pseudomonadota bacterium]